MDEADATRVALGRGWFDEFVAALIVWVGFTALVVAAAPVLADVRLLTAAVVFTPACVVVGWLAGRAFAHWRPRPAAGARLGVAVVVVGQLLDTALVTIAGEYPRAGTAGSVTVLALLLAGYPAALLGAALADRTHGRAPQHGQARTA